MPKPNESPERGYVLQLLPILLEPAEAAKVLAISERTLWEMTDRGEIRAKQVGQGEKRVHRRYLLRDLQAWAESRPDASKEAAGPSE